jgi:hypothetical protein
MDKKSLINVGITFSVFCIVAYIGLFVIAADMAESLKQLEENSDIEIITVTGVVCEEHIGTFLKVSGVKHLILATNESGNTYLYKIYYAYDGGMLVCDYKIGETYRAKVYDKTEDNTYLIWEMQPVQLSRNI